MLLFFCVFFQSLASPSLVPLSPRVPIWIKTSTRCRHRHVTSLWRPTQPRRMPLTPLTLLMPRWRTYRPAQRGPALWQRTPYRTPPSLWRSPMLALSPKWPTNSLMVPHAQRTPSSSISTCTRTTKKPWDRRSRSDPARPPGVAVYEASPWPVGLRFYKTVTLSPVGYTLTYIQQTPQMQWRHGLLPRWKGQQPTRATSSPQPQRLLNKPWQKRTLLHAFQHQATSPEQPTKCDATTAQISHADWILNCPWIISQMIS